jgi:ADP-ribose pyrophosphatase YjhB (NUDIX family)
MNPAPLAALLAAWGEELRAISQNGLLFALNDYDRERYSRIQAISAEISARVSSGAVEEITAAFAREPGYATPKVGVAAALFDGEGRMLLIQRADNKLWAMPGGWADVGFRPSEVAVKEVREETGLAAEITGLIGVYDGRANSFQNFYHLYHLVFSGRVIGGEPKLAPEEALDLGWFSEAELPPLSPGHERAIRDAFARRGSPEAFFDPPREKAGDGE